LEDECEKGNNDLSSVRNCTGDDAASRGFLENFWKEEVKRRIQRWQ